MTHQVTQFYIQMALSSLCKSSWIHIRENVYCHDYVEKYYQIILDSLNKVVRVDGRFYSRTHLTSHSALLIIGLTSNGVSLLLNINPP